MREIKEWRRKGRIRGAAMREPDHKPEARRNSKCLGSTAGEAARRQLGEEIRGYPQWLPKPHKLTVVGVSLTCKLVGDKLILVPHGRKRTRTLNRLHSGYLVWYTREMRNLVNFAISHALNHANKLVPLESDFTSSFLTGTLFLIPFVCFFFSSKPSFCDAPVFCSPERS